MDGGSGDSGYFRMALLKPDQAAKLLNISMKILTRHVFDGEIEFVNIGCSKKRPRRRFALKDIEAFVARRRQRFHPPVLHKQKSKNLSGEIVSFLAQRRQRKIEKERLQMREKSRKSTGGKQ
jgi:hypothetical protein